MRANRGVRDRLARLERLHRFQLLEQQGAPIDPASFEADDPAPPPLPPWEREDQGGENEDDDEPAEGSGIYVAQQKPEPPAGLFDDHEHPLAGNYNLSLTFTAGEVWLHPRQAPLGLHLLDREADDEIHSEP